MWFTETAWPPMLILMIGAALLLASWSSSRRALPLVAAALLLGGCGIVYVVEQQIVTERERVEAAIFRIAEAFEAGNVEETLACVSLRADELRTDIDHVLNHLDVRVEGHLRITDIDIEMLAESTRARAHFRANGRIFVGRHASDIGHYPTRWNVTWQKEGGEWVIIDAVRLDPVRGDPIGRLSQEG